jgi:hypothetical protein
MSNKNSRHQSVISRQSDESIGDDHWFKQFEKSLIKGAVQPKPPVSLFDQINSIMNGGQAKYTSVEAAVKDMQERSGVTAYNKKVSNTENVKSKRASGDENNTLEKKVNVEPIVIKKCPAIRKTLENYINTTKGHAVVPAIIEKIHSIHQGDVSSADDWEDDNLIRLVSEMNEKAKESNPNNYRNQDHNLGNRNTGADSEIDPSNTDAFHALTPVKL